MKDETKNMKFILETLWELKFLITGALLIMMSISYMGYLVYIGGTVLMSGIVGYLFMCVFGFGVICFSVLKDEV